MAKPHRHTHILERPAKLNPPRKEILGGVLSSASLSLTDAYSSSHWLENNEGRIGDGEGTRRGFELARDGREGASSAALAPLAGVSSHETAFDEVSSGTPAFLGRYSQVMQLRIA